MLSISIMFTITEVLVVEHSLFCTLFERIEGALPRLVTAREVKLLGSMVEGMLSGHAQTEASLAYSVLDHVLKEDGRLHRLHQDHHEIDGRLKRVQEVDDLAEAADLLRQAMAASREHFRREEEIIFPFLERILKTQTLETLGDAWMSSYRQESKSERFSGAGVAPVSNL
jgi:hemerythrin-like domain-containing protein